MDWFFNDPRFATFYFLFSDAQFPHVVKCLHLISSKLRGLKSLSFLLVHQTRGGLITNPNLLPSCVSIPKPDLTPSLEGRIFALLESITTPKDYSVWLNWEPERELIQHAPFSVATLTWRHGWRAVPREPLEPKPQVAASADP
jgi:hypothetical protein